MGYKRYIQDIPTGIEGSIWTNGTTCMSCIWVLHRVSLCLWLQCEIMCNMWIVELMKLWICEYVLVNSMVTWVILCWWNFWKCGNNYAIFVAIYYILSYDFDNYVNPHPFVGMMFDTTSLRYRGVELLLARGSRWSSLF